MPARNVAVELAAERAADRAHDRVHAARDARLVLVDRLHDEVAERGERETDADAEQRGAERACRRGGVRDGEQPKEAP